MEEITADEIKKGDTVICTYGGDKFKVGKVEKVSGGRIAIYNTRGKQKHISGKKVPFLREW